MEDSTFTETDQRILRAVAVLAAISQSNMGNPGSEELTEIFSQEALEGIGGTFFRASLIDVAVTVLQTSHIPHDHDLYASLAGEILKKGFRPRGKQINLTEGFILERRSHLLLEGAVINLLGEKTTPWLPQPMRKTKADKNGVTGLIQALLEYKTSEVWKALRRANRVPSHDHSCTTIWHLIQVNALVHLLKESGWPFESLITATKVTTILSTIVDWGHRKIPNNESIVCLIANVERLFYTA
jgi:hypothetical protein